MRIVRAVTAIGLLLAVTAAGTATPVYAHPAKPDFAAQARKAGLTGAEAASVQKRVDTYLARTGGTQVAFNKIDLDGKAELELALPGEVGVQAICNQGNFCAFSQTYLHGDVMRFYYCMYKYFMPFGGYGSYLNNQTVGTSAHFYDYDIDYMYDSLPAVAASPTFLWSLVYYIKPCGAI